MVIKNKGFVMEEFELVVKGFKTKAQVEAFIGWYEGQGEQDAAYWFEVRKEEGKIDIDFMETDCQKTYPIKWEENKTNLFLKI
jgi:hypothetical protein